MHSAHPFMKQAHEAMTGWPQDPGNAVLARRSTHAKLLWQLTDEDPKSAPRQEERPDPSVHQPGKSRIPRY
jgi:hypothetical protein